MRDHEPTRGQAGILARVIRPGSWQPFDIDLVAPEHEQVEIELTGTPAPSGPAPGTTLQLFEVGQEREGCASRIVATGDVQRDRGIEKVGLIGVAPGCGAVEPRHTPETDAGEGYQGPHRPLERPPGSPEVCPETDMGPNRALTHRAFDASV